MTTAAPARLDAVRSERVSRSRRMLGIVLVVAGVVWLLALLAPGFLDIRIVGPVAFIAAGAFVVTRR